MSATNSSVPSVRSAFADNELLAVNGYAMLAIGLASIAFLCCLSYIRFDPHDGSLVQAWIALSPIIIAVLLAIGVLKGLDRFEGRSSLKTWILRIVVNTAKTRGVRESRTVPYSSLAPEGEEPAVEPERFRGAQDPFPGHWRAYPSDWHRLPDEALTERETLKVVIGAIEALPPAQRMVIALRDIQGCEPEEVCSLLDVSEGNQRVLLHRARSKVRAALERHLDG